MQCDHSLEILNSTFMWCFLFCDNFLQHSDYSMDRRVQQDTSSYPTLLQNSPFLHFLERSSATLKRSKILECPQVAPSPSLGMHTCANRLMSACSRQPSSSSFEWHSLSESQKVPGKESRDDWLDESSVFILVLSKTTVTLG